MLPAMASGYDDTEAFWAAILSEQAEEVQRAWLTLDGEERTAVLTHLRRMADPAEGYAEVQQASARFALDLLLQ
jgi:hypothetical protein